MCCGVFCPGLQGCAEGCGIRIPLVSDLGDRGACLPLRFISSRCLWTALGAVNVKVSRWKKSAWVTCRLDLSEKGVQAVVQEALLSHQRGVDPGAELSPLQLPQEFLYTSGALLL